MIAHRSAQVPPATRLWYNPVLNSYNMRFWIQLTSFVQALHHLYAPPQQKEDGPPQPHEAWEAYKVAGALVPLWKLLRWAAHSRQPVRLLFHPFWTGRAQKGNLNANATFFVLCFQLPQLPNTTCFLFSMAPPAPATCLLYLMVPPAAPSVKHNLLPLFDHTIYPSS